MTNPIDILERRQLRDGLPQFKAGDTVRVHFQVIEGQRRLVQVFEGIVIKRQGAGVRETFTVRKSSFGVGVERTFPVHSPKIERIEVAAVGDVSRAKLYYLRQKVGKKARVRELGYPRGRAPHGPQAPRLRPALRRPLPGRRGRGGAGEPRGAAGDGRRALRLRAPARQSSAPARAP